MTHVATITDAGDPRLADYRNLRDARWRRRVESAEPPGFFIAEGATVVRRLLGSEVPVRSVLVDPDRRRRLADVLEKTTAPVFVAAPDVLAAIVGFDLHRGALAAAVRPVPGTLAELTASARTVAVFEGVNDHENLGAAFRSAAALGIDTVILDPTCCDPFYRRSVRVSMGGVFLLRSGRAARWPEALRQLRCAGFAVLAFTPDPSAAPLADEPIGDRVALLFGAEGPGLTAAAMAAADRTVRIPLPGPLDSLNVSHAAAIAFAHFAP